MSKICNKRLVVWLLLVTLGLASTAAAQGIFGGRWWKRPQLAQRLGLDRGQPMQIESIFQRHAAGLKNLRNELNEQDQELERLLSQERLDRDRILKQIENVEQARYRMAKQRATMLFEVRQVLSLEQWNRLQELNRLRREKTEPPGEN